MFIKITYSFSHFLTEIWPFELLIEYYIEEEESLKIRCNCEFDISYSFPNDLHFSPISGPQHKLRLEGF